jgi:hypothetical protein
MKASKIAYKPVGLAMGALSGVLAGGLFKQIWKQLGTRKAPRTPPTSTAPGARWSRQPSCRVRSSPV